MLHFLKQHLTAFVDLVSWCGLEKGTLHFNIFSMKFSSLVGCPPAGAKTWYNMAVTRISHACLLIEPGPICVSEIDTITMFVYAGGGGGGGGVGGH